MKVEILTSLFSEEQRKVLKATVFLMGFWLVGCGTSPSSESETDFVMESRIQSTGGGGGGSFYRDSCKERCIEEFARDPFGLGACFERCDETQHSQKPTGTGEKSCASSKGVVGEQSYSYTDRYGNRCDVHP